MYFSASSGSVHDCACRFVRKKESEKKKMKKTGLIFLLCSLLLTGCSNVELENRDFPTAAVVLWEDGQLGVFYAIPDLEGEAGSDKKEEKQEAVLTKGDTMEEIEKSFQYQSDKYLDMSHPKAVVFGENLMKQKEKFQEVLSYFEQKPVFARNMLVFSCEEKEKEDILDMALEGDTSFGFYLENLYKNNPDIGKEKEMTLGDLLGEIRKKEKITMPEIKKDRIDLTP